MIEVVLEGFAQAVAAAERLAVDSIRANERGLKRCAKIVHREARDNAPISPTRGVLNALRKTRRKVTRKARATSRPIPGRLRRSIAYKSDKDTADIYVSANSPAGKYAFRIHSEKGVSWFKRGPGTVAAGARADDKFIERALNDNISRLTLIMQGEHGRE